MNQEVNKTITQKSEKEIMREQLERLAEKSSKSMSTDDLCEVSKKMLEIARYLSTPARFRIRK